MRLLISLAAALFIIVVFENNIRKHAPVWYCSAFVIGLLCMHLPASTPAAVQSAVTNYIGRGTIATALFILVMYARILPPKSRLFRTLMSLRAPLAIMAALLILLHNATYFAYYARNISLRGIPMSTSERLACVCTILMLLLLLPLTITSFSGVRKRMKAKSWKKLQRLSYLFYGLIYFHVACLFGKQLALGNYHYGIELGIYTFIFGFYLIRRIALYLQGKQSVKAKNLLLRVGLPVITVVSLGLCAFRTITALIPAASVTSEGMSVSLTEQMIPESTLEQDTVPSVFYQDGEWIGSGFGFNGTITVCVTIENQQITDITVLDGSDDEPYYGWAKKELPSKIMEAQSADVDSVSGATFSSKGIKDAVNDALEQAAR